MAVFFFSLTLALTTGERLNINMPEASTPEERSKYTAIEPVTNIFAAVLRSIRTIRGSVTGETDTVNVQEDRDVMFMMHPKFSQYLDFLIDSAKPSCQSCYGLRNRISIFALSVLEKAAELDPKGTSIVSIDSQIEEEHLLRAQQELINLNAPCDGPTLENYDPTTDIAVLKQIAKDQGREIKPDLFERANIPLRDVCGIGL